LFGLIKILNWLVMSMKIYYHTHTHMKGVIYFVKVVL